MPFDHLHLSLSCFMAHKASTECFHFSRLAAIVLASFHDSHPASFVSFSTVRSQVVFGLPLLLFPFGAHVIAMLQSLFWSCLSICPIIFHLRRFTFLFIGFISALSSSSSVLPRTCHLIRRISRVRSRWLDIGHVHFLRFYGPRRSRGP